VAEERTLTASIANDLRRSITSGELTRGAPLPSETELADRYAASRGTVRHALAALVHEGLVTARKGIGYFVRDFQPLEWYPGTFESDPTRRDTPEAGADAWTADVAAQGRTPRQDVDVSIVRPPRQVAERLGTGGDEMVVVRRRLRSVDDIPYQIADSYYPRDVAEGTPIMVPGDVTVPGGLMAAAGHKQVRYRDEIYVRMPRPDEVYRIGLPAGTPVAEHVRTGFDKEGRPVRVIVTIAPGDRHVIIYDQSAE
jgi:DNA-binding GntR family transcriptional regulator